LTDANQLFLLNLSEKEDAGCTTDQNDQVWN